MESVECWRSKVWKPVFETKLKVPSGLCSFWSSREHPFLALSRIWRPSAFLTQSTNPARTPLWLLFPPSHLLSFQHPCVLLRGTLVTTLVPDNSPSSSLLIALSLKCLWPCRVACSNHKLWWLGMWTSLGIITKSATLLSTGKVITNSLPFLSGNVLVCGVWGCWVSRASHMWLL